MTAHARPSMYLARQPHGNGVGESRSATDDDVIVIGNVQPTETNGSQRRPRSPPQPHLQPQPQPEPQPEPQPQPQPQPEPQPEPQPQPSITSTSARDRETDPMRQYPSALRLRDDDDDDDDENEEEQPDDNFSATMERRAPPRVILVGWDSFRTRLLLSLIVCLLVWACVFFPLLGT